MKRILCTLLSLLVVAGVVIAQDADRRLRKEAKKFRKLEVDGAQVAANVEKLRAELTWHDSLEEALAAAAAEGKPLLWIQALGELDGYS